MIRSVMLSVLVDQTRIGVAYDREKPGIFGRQALRYYFFIVIILLRLVHRLRSLRTDENEKA